MKNIYYGIIVLALCVLSTVTMTRSIQMAPIYEPVMLVYADDVATSPTPQISASPAAAASADAPGEIKKVGDGIDQILNMLMSMETMAATVLGILFILAKRLSNEKAGPIVKMIQGIFDAVAYVFVKLGALFKYISDLLAKIVASDGIGGKQ